MSDLNPYEEGLANDLAKAQARIEQLGKACAEWADVSQSNYQRAKAAEAKLAKAVAFLDDLWDSGDYFAGELNDLRKELKGDSHD